MEERESDENRKKNKNKIKRGKIGEKEEFIFLRCIAGVNRKINKNGCHSIYRGV